jgi:adenine-specific DNA methylase
VFINEANRAIHDNGQTNRALNCDALDVTGHYDLVYIDTPYISKNGIPVDYHWFYHFLEGLAMYDDWDKHIDYTSKHRRLKSQSNDWIDKKRICAAFDRLFQRYRRSIIVVSYRSDGIPSEPELVSLLRQYKSNVRVEHFGYYKYVLSTNSESKELLLIGT